MWGSAQHRGAGGSDPHPGSQPSLLPPTRPSFLLTLLLIDGSAQGPASNLLLLVEGGSQERTCHPQLTPRRKFKSLFSRPRKPCLSSLISDSRMQVCVAGSRDFKHQQAEENTRVEGSPQGVESTPPREPANPTPSVREFGGEHFQCREQ